MHCICLNKEKLISIISFRQCFRKVKLTSIEIIQRDCLQQQFKYQSLDPRTHFSTDKDYYLESLCQLIPKNLSLKQPRGKQSWGSQPFSYHVPLQHSDI